MKTMTLRVCCLLVLAMISGCSTSPKFSDITPPKVVPSDTEGELQTVLIMGINDFHGALAPQTLKTHEAPGVTPTIYQTGGAPILAAHVQLLRSVFKSNFFILDAGDEFQGTIESNLQQGAPVVRFFNQIQLSAATLGNHEFDFGQDVLQKRMTEAHYPYLSANVIKKTDRQSPAYPNFHSHIILTSGRLKLGVIGLSTIETASRTRPEFVSDLEFTSLRDATVREAAALRKAGANIIVVSAHAGLTCDLSYFQYGQSGSAPVITPQTEAGSCGSDDEIVKLLKALPLGTVDAVIAGHTHQIVHHFIAGVPVVQDGASGKFYNLIYLTYDWKRHKLLADQTKIEGAIPLCSKVFKNQGDCDGTRPAPLSGRGALVAPVFHGATLYEDSDVASLLKADLRQSEQARNRIVGQAVRPIAHMRRQESEMGNLVADAIRIEAKSDFAMVNSGSIRAPFDAGPITYESLFRALPFDNSIMIVKVTGKELKNVLRTAENGTRGFFPVSGLKLRVIDLKYDAPVSNAKNSKKIEPWEFDRLVEVKTADGSTIQDKKTYTLAMPDYLVNGGDDMNWVMSKIPARQIRAGGIGLMRDAVQTYLAQSGPVNSDQQPLIDPDNPRIKQVKPPETSRKHRRKSQH